jgi:hypothetical protein
MIAYVFRAVSTGTALKSSKNFEIFYKIADEYNPLVKD